MINNSSILKKYPSSQDYDNTQTSLLTVRGLQHSIDPKNFLQNKDRCHCKLCIKQQIIDQKFQDLNLFETRSKSSTVWLKKLLDALCLSGAKTLKLNIPDLLFVVGQSFQTFQTNRKNSCLVKLSGTTPLKSLYATMIRYRKQYKYMLQVNFNEKMLQSIDPQLMHLSYFDKFVPTHFHQGMRNIQDLKENRSQFKRYVLHKHKKYEIQQIQEHKMNAKQLFCIVKYTDGNCRLFTQVAFEVYMLGSLTKIQQQVVYIESYIKYKLQTKAIYYSQYNLTPHSTLTQIDKKAQNWVMVLLGALSKYDQGFTDPATIDEISHHLMIHTPQKYVDLMTHKIVHYLNMTSRIYIEHVKIKWIMNDLGTIYLQQIMQFEMSQVPRRLIRFRLPPKGQAMDIVTNTNNFGDLYLEMKKKKNINTARIKKMINGKPADFILDLMQIQQRKSPVPQRKQEQENKMLEQYFKQKMNRVQAKTNTYPNKPKDSDKKCFQRTNRKLTQNYRYRSLQSRGKNNQSCTIQFFSKPTQQLQQQKVKQNFKKYFTIDTQNKSNSQKPTTSHSSRNRAARMSVHDQRSKKSHRYSRSLVNPQVASERYFSIDYQ